MPITPQPLDYQQLLIPLTGGLDTKTDPKVVQPTKLLLCENAEFTEGGSLKKRPGNLAIPARDVSANGYRGTPRALGAFGRSLAVLTSNSVYSYVERDQAVDRRGTYYPVVHRILNQVALAEEVKNAEAATASNVTVMAWEAPGSLVKLLVFDSSSGSVYYSNAYVGSTGGDAVVASTAISPRVFAIGNVVYVTWANISNNSIQFIMVRPWDVRGSLAASPGTMVEDLASNRLYDICELNGTTAAITYNSDNTVATGVRLALINTAGAAYGHVSHHATNATIGVAIAYDGTDIFVASQDAAERIARYNSSMLVSEATVSIVTAGTRAGVAIAPHNGGLAVYSTYTAADVWDYSTNIDTFDSSLTHDTLNTVRHSFVASGGFTDGEHGFCLLAHQSRTGLQNSYYMYSGDAVLAGRMLQIQGPSFGEFTGNRPNIRSAENGLQCLLGYQKQLDSLTETLANKQHLAVKHIQIDFEAVPSTTQVDKALYATGSHLWYFDGSVPVESGFHMFPDMLATDFVSSNGAGALTNSGAYNYRVYYCWLSPITGQKMRSAAITRSPVLSASDDFMEIDIPTLSFTQKQAMFGVSDVWIEVFRTEANAATLYFKVTSDDPALTGTNGWVNNDPTVDFVSFADGLSDSDLVERELDYISQGEISHFSPTAGEFIKAVGNRIFMVGGAIGNNSVVFSLEHFDGEPVDFAFQTIFSDAPEEGGKIKGIGYLNEIPIFFKERAIFALIGSGINATNTDGSYQAQTISTDVGVANPKTIVELPNAVLWDSAKGIYGMTSSLNPEYAGALVEGFNDQDFVAARVIPDTNMVLFVASDGNAVFLDYYYNQWGTFTNHLAKDCAVYQEDTLVTLKTDDRLFIRDTSVYTDGGSTYVYKWRTAPIRPDSVQRFFKMNKFILIGDYLSAHMLRVSLFYNREPTPYQTYDWDPADVIDTTLWGESGIIWGQQNMIWGGSRNPIEYQHEKRPMRSKFQTISFQFEEIPGVAPGASLQLTELLLSVAEFNGHARISATRKV